MINASFGNSATFSLAGLEAHTWGEVEGSGLVGSQGPHIGGGVEGSGLGGLQAHPGGRVSRATPGGSPGQHLGCVYPSMH